jgi:PAS domain S-box-containing protein
MQAVDYRQALLDEIKDLSAEAFPNLLQIVHLYKEAVLATQAAISLQYAHLVADLKRAEEAARGNELRFRHLFENVPLCIFEVDLTEPDPVILAANRRAEAVYGWREGEFTTLKSGQLVPPEANSEISRMVEAVRAGRTVALETTNLRRDGTRFAARIIATPEKGPHVNHMVISVEDISAEKQRRSEREAIDAERRRIAQEIHDGVAQYLAALRLKSAVWHDWVDTDPAQMHTELDELQNTLDEAMEEIRRSIFALRPVALDEAGFFPALHQYVTDFSDQYPVYTNLEIKGREACLPATLEPRLFRIVQEALNNIAKHSQASLAWVELDLTEDQAVTLTIRDNGQGFDLADLKTAVRAGHLGLKQMRERVEGAKGTLLVDSEPGHGTLVQAVLPLEESGV